MPCGWSARASPRSAAHEMGILIITHYERLLEHNKPDFMHVMLGGRIVETGGPELAAELHKQGYDRIRAAYPEAAADEAEMEARRSEQNQPSRQAVGHARWHDDSVGQRHCRPTRSLTNTARKETIMATDLKQ